MLKLRSIYEWMKTRQALIEGFWAPLSSIAANVIVVLTLVLALATYYQAQSLGQVQASLAYVDKFNAEEVLKARNLIYRTWLPYDFSGAGGGLSPEVVKELIDRVVPDVSTPEGLEHRLAVASIVAFFDSAQTCMDQRVCNEEALRSQVGEYGRDFQCLYRSLIERERERGRIISFGSGLAKMTERMGGC